MSPSAGAPAIHTVLVGMMGAGKSTVGAALATRLGVRYADNDVELVHRTGRDAATVLADENADALHAIEHRILADALAHSDRSIVGAPGSLALDPGGPALVRGQQVVWLRASVDTLVARVHRDPVRPLLGARPEDRLAELLAEREPGFARLATLVVDVDDLTVEAIVDRIAMYRAAP